MPRCTDGTAGTAGQSRGSRRPWRFAAALLLVWLPAFFAVAMLPAAVRASAPAIATVLVVGEVVNASISGDTTAGGRSRIGPALQTHTPEVVIIELGGNDGLRGSALPQVKANLDYMVAAAKKAGAQVLLLGMQLPPNYGTRYVKDFSALFGDVAASRNVVLVPFLLETFGDKPEMFQADRIHPKAEAQALMLDAVWPALRKLLPLSSAPAR